jgi:hypothetical protein
MSFREVFTAADRTAIRWYSLRNVCSRNQWQQRYQECYDKIVTSAEYLVRAAAHWAKHPRPD